MDYLTGDRQENDQALTLSLYVPVTAHNGINKKNVAQKKKY